MPPDDDIRNDNSTFNELSNEDREWLERNGYQPGELTHQEITRLREEEADTDDDSERPAVIGDEMDGTDADAS